MSASTEELSDFVAETTSDKDKETQADKDKSKKRNQQPATNNSSGREEDAAHTGTSSVNSKSRTSPPQGTLHNVQHEEQDDEIDAGNDVLDDDVVIVEKGASNGQVMNTRLISRNARVADYGNRRGDDHREYELPDNFSNMRYASETISAERQRPLGQNGVAEPYPRYCTGRRDEPRDCVPKSASQSRQLMEDFESFSGQGPEASLRQHHRARRDVMGHVNDLGHTATFSRARIVPRDVYGRYREPVSGCDLEDSRLPSSSMEYSDMHEQRRGVPVSARSHNDDFDRPRNSPCNECGCHTRGQYTPQEPHVDGALPRRLRSHHYRASHSMDDDFEIPRSRRQYHDERVESLRAHGVERCSCFECTQNGYVFEDQYKQRGPVAEGRYTRYREPIDSTVHRDHRRIQNLDEDDDPAKLPPHQRYHSMGHRLRYYDDPGSHRLSTRRGSNISDQGYESFPEYDQTHRKYVDGEEPYMMRHASAARTHDLRGPLARQNGMGQTVVTRSRARARTQRVQPPQETGNC